MSPEVQAFLGEVTLADVLIWAAAIGAVFAAFKWVIPFARKASHFIDDVAGEPARPGSPARAGLMERVTNIEGTQAEHGKTIETVRHELFPNSGKSLRDQTNRMERKLDADNDRILDLAKRLDEHITQSSQIINKLTKE